MKKRSKAFEEIMAGLQEALAHARGETTGIRLHHIKAPKIRKLSAAKVRAKAGMSQAAFAKSIGVSVATLRNWEAGHRQPTGPALVLLNLLDRNPRIVQETLAA